MFDLGWQTISKVVLHCTIPGLFAGIVLFLYSYTKKHYKNNKYLAKLITELLGAGITATFIAQFLKDPGLRIIVAFCIGLTWTRTIQLMRTKITRIVEVLLENSYGGK